MVVCYARLRDVAKLTQPRLNCSSTGKYARLRDVPRLTQPLLICHGGTYARLRDVSRLTQPLVFLCNESTLKNTCTIFAKEDLIVLLEHFLCDN